MSNQLNDVTLSEDKYKKLKRMAEIGEIVVQAVEDDEMSAAQLEALLIKYRGQ